MPLEPSIFMNSAALYAQNMNGLRDSISTAAGRYQQGKQFEAQTALDREKMRMAQEQQQQAFTMEREKLEAMRSSPEAMAKRLEAESQIAAYDVMQGKPVSPERATLADAFFRSQSKTSFDPTTGRLVLNNAYSDFIGKPRSVASALLPQDVGGGQPAPDMPVQRGSLAAPMRGDDYLPDVVAEDGAPTAGQITQSASQQLRDTMLPQGIRIDAPPSYPQSGNPKLDQVIMEETAKSNININEAAEKAKQTELGKTTAESDARKTALKKLANSFAGLEKYVEGTSEGLPSKIWADARNLAGSPSQQSIKNSAFDTARSLTYLQSRIDFMKGQGTITEGEGKSIQALLPDISDPIPVKREKIKSAVALLEEMGGSGAAQPQQQKIQNQGQSGGDEFSGYSITIRKGAR